MNNLRMILYQNDNYVIFLFRFSGFRKIIFVNSGEFCSSFAIPGTADCKIVVLRVNVLTFNVGKGTPWNSATDSI